MEGGNTNITVDELIGSTQAPTEPAALPEEFDTEGFSNSLSTVTGGRLKSHEEINGLLGIRDKYSSLEKEVAELRPLKDVNPFTDSGTERINQMRNEGKSWGDIVRFMEIQSIDVNNMSAEEAIKNSKRFESGWDQQKVDRWFNSKYPVPPEPTGEDDASTYAALKEDREIQIEDAAIGAKAELSKMKVDMDQPNSDMAAQKAASEELFSKMTDLGQKLVSGVDKLSIDVEGKGDFNGYNFDFNLKELLTDEQRSVIAENAAKQALSMGYGFDKRGLEFMQNLTNNTIRAAFFDEIFSAAAHDMWASAREAAAKEQANLNPPPKGTIPPRGKAKKGGLVTNVNGQTFV